MSTQITTKFGVLILSQLVGIGFRFIFVSCVLEDFVFIDALSKIRKESNRVRCSGKPTRSNLLQWCLAAGNDSVFYIQILNDLSQQRFRSITSQITVNIYFFKFLECSNEDSRHFLTMNNSIINHSFANIKADRVINLCQCCTFHQIKTRLASIEFAYFQVNSNNCLRINSIGGWMKKGM